MKTSKTTIQTNFNSVTEYDEMSLEKVREIM